MFGAFLQHSAIIILTPREYLFFLFK